MAKKQQVSLQSIALDFVNDKNNNTIFTQLINRIKPGLNNYIRKYIEDEDVRKEVITQTMITMWEKAHQYNPKYNFSTWAYAIARNEALGIIRTSKKTVSHDKLTENHSKLLATFSPTVSMDIEIVGPKGDEIEDVLYEYTIKEINSLKEPYKSVMIHREVMNMQLKDIADKLKWNESTVKTRLRKARKDIMTRVIKKYPDLMERYYDKQNE